MDKISKKISTNSSYSRYNGKLPAVSYGEYRDGYDEFGRIDEEYTDFNLQPMSVIVTEGDSLYDLHEKLGMVPLEEWMLPDDSEHFGDVDGKYAYRYRTIFDTYGFLIGFMPKCEYMMLCMRNGSEKWITLGKGYFGKDMTAQERFLSFDELPVYDPFYDDFSGFSVGDVICFNEDADKFNSLFRVDGSEKRYESDFLDFVGDLLSGEPKSVSECAKPYLNVPLYIANDYDDMGSYEDVSKIWVESKKYYIGDTVLYPYEDDFGAIYKLVKGDSVEIVEISEKLYKDSYKDMPSDTSYTETYKSSAITEDGIEKYYLNVPFYRGYFDESVKVCYFDTFQDGVLTIEHWEQQNGNGKEIVSGTSTGISESVLQMMVGNKKSYDDDSNLTPFYVDVDNNVCIKYPVASYLNGNKCNVMKTVSFYDEDDNLLAEFDENGYVKNSDIPENASFVVFKYIVGADYEITDDNIVPVEGTGVIYTDRYAVVPNSVYYCNYTEATVFEWVKIPQPSNPDEAEIVESYDILTGNTPTSSNLGIVYVIGDDDEKHHGEYYTCYSKFIYCDIVIANTGFVETDGDGDTIYSMIEFYNEQAASDDFQIATPIKNESTIGLQDIKVDADVNIERGTHASFERHNILGEVCTFEDLLNYKNNMFKL